jgi:hypothetical protein
LIGCPADWAAVGVAANAALDTESVAMSESVAATIIKYRARVQVFTENLL